MIHFCLPNQTMRDLIYSDKFKIDVAKLDELNLHKEREVGGGGAGRGGQ